MEDMDELHENCDDDCEYCRRRAIKREKERYADAQVAYYAPGSIFDILFDGAFDEKSI